MQNEMNFFDHCNVIEYNHDFVIIFKKIDNDTLEYEVLDSNVYSYLIDY